MTSENPLAEEDGLSPYKVVLQELLFFNPEGPWGTLAHEISEHRDRWQAIVVADDHNLLRVGRREFRTYFFIVHDRFGKEVQPLSRPPLWMDMGFWGQPRWIREIRAWWWWRWKAHRVP